MEIDLLASPAAGMLTVDVQRHGGGVVDVPWQGEEGTEAERPGHLLPLRPPVVAVEVEVVENDARQLLDSCSIAVRQGLVLRRTSTRPQAAARGSLLATWSTVDPVRSIREQEVLRPSRSVARAA